MLRTSTKLLTPFITDGEEGGSAGSRTTQTARGLCQDYSGIIINQNGTPTGSLKPSGWYYQRFKLPSNYRYGVQKDQIRYPELSGIQLFVKIPPGKANEASLEYTLQRNVFGVGWTSVASGAVLGSHADGARVWMDVFFNDSVPVTSQTAEGEWRIGIKVLAAIDELWYVSPAIPNEESYAVATPRAATFNFRLLALTADSGIDFLGNPYRSVVIRSDVENTSTTEGITTGYWRSSPQPSKFAVVSNYFDVRVDPGDGEATQPAVIDSILLDPQTPNVAFNVYYSSDGESDEQTTTKEWEKKLWTHVPKTFIATQRQTYVLPVPITARFVKIEYSHLQPYSYNPGDFQAPVTYKKFPKWVAGYFFSQLKLPTFVANRVEVSYDALQFAYQYYLDDLQQRSEAPVSQTRENELAVTKFFDQSDASNLVDPATLAQIKLAMNVFTSAPAMQSDPSTLLGYQAKKTAEIENTYPVEDRPIQSIADLLSVSTANRENIVLEESTPIMFFFLPCRHAYKELEATFESNRAYFAGVNEIAFLRNNYLTSSDEEVFIETGVDSENLDINDFVIGDDGTWTTF